MTMKKTVTLLLGLWLSLQAAAQKNENIFIRLGVNAGGSMLFHNTHFYATNLQEVYKFVSISHKDKGGYSWEEFEKDYGLRSRYAQPRYGLNAYFAHRLFPVFGNVEFMSSPSSYQKMSVALTLGLGKDFRPFDSDYFFSAHGGFKRVFRDWGWGAETITYSTNAEARQYLKTFYNPDYPLGVQSGNLLALRVGVGRVVGPAERAAIGLEGFYEVDLTNETVRQARMTNAGVNVYFRFDLVHTSF